MYAIHESGMAAAAPLAPAFVGPSQGQVEPRAVESTERGALESEGRDEAIHRAGSPVVQLIEDSARGYAQMMEMIDQTAMASASTSGAYLGASVGGTVDIYA